MQVTESLASESRDQENMFPKAEEMHSQITALKTKVSHNHSLQLLKSRTDRTETRI